MNFITSNSGAVTVDWVVLTAGLVGLGLATMSVVSSGTEDLSGDVSNQLQRSGNLISTTFNAGFEPVPCTPSTALEQEHSELFCAMNATQVLTGVTWGAGDASAYFAETVETYQTVDEASLMAQIAGMSEQDYIDNQARIDQMIALVDMGATEQDVYDALDLPAINNRTGLPLIEEGGAKDYLNTNIAASQMNLHFQTARIAVAEERGFIDP